MGISELQIVKRDGKRETFSIEKIKRAVSKAFLSVGGYATEDDLISVLGRVHVSDGMSVEEIQNQVEVALMAERYFAVAKSYMLYRQKHAEDREDREKLDFLIDYCDASNPASGSKYDANANVENKNIATLIGELPKRNFIRLNRRLLTDRIKEMYGKELADKYLHLLNNHFIYKNDETSMANYCASITMYPWLLNGTLSVGGNSKRPTNLKSFCGGFVNMVFIVSSMLSGACATPEFLTRSSPTASSRSSTRLTSPQARATSKPSSGTWPTTTATISRVFSASSASRTARGRTGNRFRGCRSAS